ELGRTRLVLGVGIAGAGRRLREDHVDAVVSRPGRERGSLIVVDHIVRRREQIARRTGLVEVVTEALERADPGHGPCLYPAPGVSVHHGRSATPGRRCPGETGRPGARSGPAA